MTISLLMMGNWLTFSNTRLAFLPMAKMPMAAKVPITVAITEDTAAMRKVLPTASHRAGDFSEVKMEMYASNVNPSSKREVGAVGEGVDDDEQYGRVEDGEDDEKVSLFKDAFHFYHSDLPTDSPLFLLARLMMKLDTNTKTSMTRLMMEPTP